MENIMAVLPESIRVLLESLPSKQLSKLEELRLRLNLPLILVIDGKDSFITEKGVLTVCRENIFSVTPQDMQKVLQLVSGSSVYALEDELKNGYITMPGGHRIGLCGKVVTEKGRVKTIKHVSSINMRVSREIPGAASKLIPYVIDRDKGTVKHTLLVSPPRCGKTTLLRDLVRQISNGIPSLSFPGTTVGLVDERSELAGCYYGLPQKDVGLRTDVLDACPKAEGMIMLLRAMSPQVIATDEIGRAEDVRALEEVFHAGVKVITTVHAASIKELIQRPALKYLLELKTIDRYIILSRTRGVGTIEEIIDGRTMQLLEVKTC
nr:stage III sporulation protein AA [Desulfofarcimen acetoxidans]